MDAVIIDLEDSVSEPDKVGARDNPSEFASDRSALVRINSRTSEFFEHDVRTLAGLKWVSGIVLPKVDSPSDGARFRDIVGGELHLHAIIESLFGDVQGDAIAASGVNRLAFESADFAAEIGAAATDLVVSPIASGCSLCRGAAIGTG